MAKSTNPAITELSESQVISIREIVVTEIKNNRKWPSKETLIFVIVCLLTMVGIIFFSMKYIADMGQDILLQFTEIAENITIENTAEISASDSSNATNENKIYTHTVEIERNGLLSADYLAVVLPVLITVAGSFIVFLGMNRLKMYDERIDSTRADLIKELNTLVANQVSAAQAKQTERVKETLSLQQEEFNKTVTDAIADLEQQANTHRKTINDAGAVYDWLKATIEQNEFDVNVHTVYDAHRLVALLRHKKPDNYVPLIKEIVNRVCSNSLSGDSADYHNLSAELARGSMYNEANQVLNTALNKLFPHDTDLLADLINYATKGGMTDNAANALQQLLKIDRRLWTWRCYIFSSDYYQAIGDLESALKMCDACIAAFPFDQHGYRDKAEIIKKMTPGMEGIQNSINILNEALNANINCPQCSNLLGETYMNLGQYGSALSAFNRCVVDLAKDQPGISEAYVFYNRATCYDRMFMQNPDCPEHLLNALQDYVTARKLAENTNDTSTTMLMQINNRLMFLQRYLPGQDDGSV